MYVKLSSKEKIGNSIELAGLVCKYDTRKGKQRLIQLVVVIMNYNSSIQLHVLGITTH